MKRLFFALLMGAVAACAGQGGDATSTDGTATMATSAETAATTPDTTTSAAPAAVTTEDKPMSYENKVAVLKTSAGEIHIRFFNDVAPNHVKNFLDLGQKGFYNGTKFHRVIPGFMIQGGDPNTKSGDPSTWGTGGSGTNVKAEFNRVPHTRGIVSMARSQSPDSASSQFFIVVKDSPWLNGEYTAFGQVTKGMDVADTIVNAASDPRTNRPNNPTMIESVTIRDANDDEKGPAPKG